MNTNIVFTRYLYLKSGVLESLECSILKNDFQESLFWGYEIYYSGFEEEIFDFLFLKKKRKEKNEDNLGTIIKNMCLRNHLLMEGTGRQVYVIINHQDIENQKQKQ